MKTKNYILTLALGLMTTFSFAQLITGSPHDFKALAWNDTGEICITCHTPHNALAEPGAPLWNHTVTTQTFNLYDNVTSSTFDATTTQPAGTSKLCLSCHDGTVDLENFAGNGAITNTTIGAGGLLGTNLEVHHPVSFTYDAALVAADGGTGLNDPASGPVSALLFATKVECASCHDAHNNANGSFLRATNAASALCLTCHNK